MKFYIDTDELYPWCTLEKIDNGYREGYIELTEEQLLEYTLALKTVEKYQELFNKARGYEK